MRSYQDRKNSYRNILFGSFIGTGLSIFDWWLSGNSSWLMFPFALAALLFIATSRFRAGKSF